MQREEGGGARQNSSAHPHPFGPVANRRSGTPVFNRPEGICPAPGGWHEWIESCPFRADDPSWEQDPGRWPGLKSPCAVGAKIDILAIHLPCLHFPVPHFPVINSPAGFMTGTWRTGKWEHRTSNIEHRTSRDSEPNACGWDESHVFIRVDSRAYNFHRSLAGPRPRRRRLGRE
jgi:hypothetical protein